MSALPLKANIQQCEWQVAGHSGHWPAQSVRLHRQGAQLKRRQTGHHVERDRTLKRKRLKRNGAVGTAKEDVRASTQANANISGNADIFSSERSGDSPVVGANTA